MGQTAGARRMGKLDRTLRLVHALAETSEGLTLDELAELLDCNRRTVERMMAVVKDHFWVDEISDDRRKRFVIRDSMRRHFTRPNAAEIAALRSEAMARRRENAPHADLLESLTAKLFGALDAREKLSLDTDLEALVRLQRSRVTAGPRVEVAVEALDAVRMAILVGRCVAFDYTAEGRGAPRWRRVIPYGLVQGPITYLIGRMSDRDTEPLHFRLDRMQNVQVSDTAGSAPEDWDLDEWLSRSFGIWHEEQHNIVLRVRAPSASRARQWRFHASQQMEDDGEELVIRFTASGLREMAEHLFSWGGEIVIEEPEALRAVMAERLEAATASLQVRQ